MNVSACLVTRGDVDLTEIVFSLPEDCELLIWNNGSRRCGRYWAGLGKPEEHSEFYDVADLAVYGRYAAIEYTSGDLIYVQDDDVVLPPESIKALIDRWEELAEGGVTDVLVANMPERFRVHYTDSCLVGFGAVFSRSLPAPTWGRLTAAAGDAGFPADWAYEPSFLRTCDVPFTALNPRVLLDLPYENLSWAEDETRMYRSENHVAERTRMLDLVRRIR